ncbi:MAG: DUF547 domain-containing protein [Gemmataceae bacterium]
MRKLKWILGVFVVVVAAWGAYMFFLKPKTVIGTQQTGDRPALGAVDHAAFDQLLRDYVNAQGLVAYARWKANHADMKKLDDYLEHLGNVDLQKDATREEKLAYWINAYNALTLKGILNDYPIKSVKSPFTYVGGYNMWTDLEQWIGGERYSLDRIEHKTLRLLGEPRIHFGLVCGARSCPILRNHAYTPDKVLDQLDDNARRFFARDDALYPTFEIEPDIRQITISPIFKWYGSDFAPTPIEVVRKLKPYFPAKADTGWLDEAGAVQVDFAGYDWTLNDQAP